MAKNEHKRQQKLDKKRKKRADAKSAERKHQAEEQARRKEAKKHIHGTHTCFWPQVYRSLFFDIMPDFTSGMNFKGTELHVKIYPSQEDRRAGTNGEVVSALKIESCEEYKPLLPTAGVGDNFRKTFRCKGRLIQQIKPETVYGNWFRMQPYHKILVPDDEFQEDPVSFELKVIYVDEGVGENVNSVVANYDQLSLTPGAWNVVQIVIPDNLRQEASGMIGDRLVEMLNMLRIVTPILTAENEDAFRQNKLRHELEAELKKQELEEREAMAALLQCSERCKGIYAEFVAKAEDAMALEKEAAEELDRLDTLYKLAQAEFDRISKLPDLATNPEAQALHRKARKTLSLCRDNWIAARNRSLQQQSALAGQSRQSVRIFSDAMLNEWLAADRVTIALFRWQRAAVLLEYCQAN